MALAGYDCTGTNDNVTELLCSKCGNGYENPGEQCDNLNIT